MPAENCPITNCSGRESCVVKVAMEKTAHVWADQEALRKVAAKSAEKGCLEAKNLTEFVNSLFASERQAQAS